MAILNWQIFSLPKGSAGPLSDYVWGQGYHAGKEDIVHRSFGNLPHWCAQDPTVFFRDSDTFERRRGAAARHLVVTLPRELTLREWIVLTERLIATDIGTKPYQYAIHVPRGDDPENANPHAHILYCDRIPDGLERTPQTFFRRPNYAHPELGGCKKDSGGLTRQEMGANALRRRQAWADLQNNALRAAGSS
jgi:hypothetical protein